MTKSHDLLLPENIQFKLNTKMLGRDKIIHFYETDSTNDRAEILAEKGAKEGTLVIAEYQTKGKGRAGRTWFSPAGDGIYLSLILRPQILPVEAPRITIITAVAAAEAILKHYEFDLRIKWPNDILINEKKAAGILTTMNTIKNSINYVIVGIGINVNTTKDSMPDEIKKIATSFFIESGIKKSRIELIQSFLSSFEHVYYEFISGNFKLILEKWKKYSQIIGKHVEVDITKQKLYGEVIDITGDGFLILREDSGKEHKIISGDVIKIS